ncbi:MAG: thiolase family protein [Desulfobacteraceae bacterium]|jgi:acetyl-CoA C-acetyltransferase|nr:MAG: thiolase family protein [Desulfobacteraceae bacterium]
MRDVVVVSACRTPIGDFGGSLKSLKPFDLIVPVIEDSLKRAGIEKSQVDQVIVGNCFAPLEQNIGRITPLLAGFPYETPGFTINCACASASMAVIQGVNAIAMGQVDVVLAGGVESMSNAPYVMDTARWGQRLKHANAYDLVWKSMQEYPVGGGMGIAAERLADKYGLSRQEQDELAVTSHKRAVKAIMEGRFKREIVPLNVPAGRGKSIRVDTDEHPRNDTSLESLSKLQPAFKEGGTVTAGNASGINDGAVAVLLMAGERASRLGVKTMAGISAFNVAAVDPHLVGIAPVPAIKKVLQQRELSLADIQLFEINEAFASYYLATEKELGLNREITNVNGSGISLGHPVGCTGGRILVSLIYEMERQDLHRGISALCAGGGVGTAILVER